MPLVSAKQLHRSYGVRTILAGVNVSLEQGERVGLVGRNGSGKSTLAKLLCGHEQPDAGEVVVQRGIRALYLEQEPILEDGFTARETVLRGLGEWSLAHARYLECSAALETGGQDTATLTELVTQQAEAAAEVERLGGWDRAHEAEAILDKLGVHDPDAIVTHFSGGERRRVALARILVARPDLAILDEPTNHLDVGAIEWLEQFLSEQYPGTVLLITHDRYVLNRVVTRTLEIDEGILYSY
ncbi:MAG: ATP-binding cassette domain-containing protein, partial [Nannocystaceae bacterium]